MTENKEHSGKKSQVTSPENANHDVGQLNNISWKETRDADDIPGKSML
jgi:hypothetical protein